MTDTRTLTLPDGETEATVTYDAQWCPPEREHGFLLPGTGGYAVEIERVLVDGNPVVLTDKEYETLADEIAVMLERMRDDERGHGIRWGADL